MNPKTKIMKTIQLKINRVHHLLVELTNDKGDVFSYNPQKHEGLEDFLSSAKEYNPKTKKDV